MDNQAIGMMDKAYFVGKREILGWINELLQLNLAKIEETATGAVACQILDAMYPGKVNMKKVQWSAKHEHEFVKNYAVLQTGFDKLKIDRFVDVQKLVRAKFQDNLEFMQWFKRYFELNVGDGASDYDAAGRRAGGKGAPKALSGGVRARPNLPTTAPRPGMESPGGAKGTSAARAPRAPRAAPAAAPLEEKTTNRRPAPGRQGAKAGSARARPGAAAASASASAAAASAAPVAPTSSAADQKEIADLKHESAELKVTMEGLERERDFYFGKLRDIEIMLQQDEPAEEDDQTPVARSIYKILYATEEDMPAEEGAVEEAEADLMADAAVPLAAC